MKWNELAVEFEELAKDGDANVEWVFYARKGIAAQWLISDDQTNVPHRDLWHLFGAAGRLLPTEGAPRSAFPTRLLREPTPDWRWLSALRHLNVHVVRRESLEFRSDRGMIHAVATASAKLCRRLAECDRFPRVDAELANGPIKDWPASQTEDDRGMSYERT